MQLGLALAGLLSATLELRRASLEERRDALLEVLRREDVADISGSRRSPSARRGPARGGRWRSCAPTPAARIAATRAPARSPGRAAVPARGPLGPVRSGTPPRRRTRRRATGGTWRCPTRRAARSAPSPRRAAPGRASAPAGRTARRTTATTMSPAKAISIPIVKVIPCTAVTNGLSTDGPARTDPPVRTPVHACAARPPRGPRR